MHKIQFRSSFKFISKFSSNGIKPYNILYGLYPIWVQSEIFMSLYWIKFEKMIELLCKALFQCYLVCKMYEDKKTENWYNQYIAQSIDKMSSSIKLYKKYLNYCALNLVLTHSLNVFTVTKRISDWHHFCKWKFL